MLYFVTQFVTFFTDTEECEHGQLRLTGRASNASGILEICYSGSYGKVCYDNLWSRQENIVVACRQLGFNLNSKLNNSDYFVYMLINCFFTLEHQNNF